MLQQTLNDIRLWLLLSLTLGLAPFVPEPHVWGKLKWLLGDPSSMQLMDYLDLLMHGLPWLFLLRAVIIRLKSPKASSLS